jgi:glycosyltransferase involved in cell wall biosynthesis
VRVVFLIRSLEIGGAERQLVALAGNLDREIFDVSVLCSYDGGVFIQELSSAGVPVILLGKKGRWHIFGFIRRLIRVLRKLQPDILHSYLTGQNVMATLLRFAIPTARIVWGVRASDMDFRQYDWLARALFRLEALLSRFPNLIIFNSFEGRAYHLLASFDGSRTVVIPNGIDTKRFVPDAKLGARLRASWRLPEGSLVIGIAARLDPMKGHQTFLEAAAIFARDRPDARFVCIGGGPDEYLCSLRALTKRLSLVDKVIWAGFVRDMPSAYNALDIFCSSSSYGEGTSNAIAEAMACGVPCVVTGVGDSRLIVGETGVVVEPRNPEALAAGWVAMAGQITHNPHLRAAVRQRIEEKLSLSILVHKTSETLLGLL